MIEILTSLSVGALLLVPTSPPVGSGDGAGSSAPSCSSEEHRLLPADGATNLEFGWSVALREDTALIGVPFSGEAGAAYVFAHVGGSWVQQAKLLAGDGGSYDHFGEAVAVNEERAAVGAPASDGASWQTGSVYVFAREGAAWRRPVKIFAADGEQGDRFGYSVSMSGDTILVGAWSDDAVAWNSGSAYVFVLEGSTWIQQAKLVPSDGAYRQYFGWSVALSGDVALVGAYRDDEHGDETGAVYAFARVGATWTEEAKLLAGDGAAGDRFGWSVALSGDTALIGAYRDQIVGFESGSAYVFRRDAAGWSEEAKLLAPDVAEWDHFGWSVAVDGDRAVVGAPAADLAGATSGSAYLFVRHGPTWSDPLKLVPSDAAPTDEFGWSVAVDGEWVVAGAIESDALGSDSGAAYAIAPLPPAGTSYCACAAGPCGNSDLHAGCANSTGAGAHLSAFGRTLPDEVDLLVAGARPGQPALFFEGDLAVLLPFGDGLRCAGGGLVRLHTPRPSEADGSAAFGPCSGDPTISSITGVVPGSGESRRYQYWYRDPGGPCSSGFNLSDAYEIIW